MMMGRVAFPGNDEDIIFQSITERNIKWPQDDDTISDLMSPYARDLFDKMVQVDPTKRISVQEIKLHPYFFQNNIDFNAVSSKDFVRAKECVDEILDELVKEA